MKVVVSLGDNLVLVIFWEIKEHCLLSLGPVETIDGKFKSLQRRLMLE